MKRITSLLTLAILTLPSVASAAVGTDTPQFGDETAKIAHAVTTCRATPSIKGCDQVLLFATAVDQVNQTAAAGSGNAATIAPSVPATVAGRILPVQSGTALPPPDSPKASPALEFTATTTTKTASIGWTVPIGRQGNVNQALTFTVQTPIDQDADFENVATLDGMTKSTTVEMKYSRFDAVGAPWLIQVNAKYGAEQHTFFSSTDLAKSSTTRYPYQVGASFDLLLRDKALSTPDSIQFNSSIGLSYNFQHAYTDGGKSPDKQVLCPAATAGPVKCISGFIDAPIKTDKNLIAVNYKLISKSFAIAPSITYNASSHEYGIGFPLYLIPNASSFLTGGFRYDWNSDKHESVLGVFVTSPLCLIPGKSKCSGG